MNIRSFALAAASIAAIAVIGLAEDAVKPALTPHPHFNDGGTLSWSTKAADVQALAKKSDRLIFIEYGREA